MKSGEMLEVLHRAERALPVLLGSAEWKSIDVNYEPPRVERLWVGFESQYRLSLHRIHPCAAALFHPHPWPSAVRILDGRYEMGVGYGKESPPEAARLILAPGSEYEMIDPDAWHSVRPLSRSTLSIMVTGLPWARPSPGKDKTFSPLSQQEVKDLLADIAKHYPR
ncbi:MAG: hypothetical protein Q8O67_20040 [Deltaproteobacteria bacterium]|nr:hypothetical protein [Deltaproteobacteria bacterium]